MATIIYQGQVFEQQALLYANLNEIKDDYLKESLLFCRKWLQGQQTFEVQTSGSTGSPKMMYPTRKAMEASIQISQNFFKWKGGENVLVCLHTQYIAGKMMLLRGLQLAWTMHLQKPNNNPLEYFDKPLDFAAFVPLQIQNIIEKCPDKLSVFTNQASLIIGGVSISLALEEKIRQISNPKIFQTYGMTETLSHIALRRLNGEKPQENFVPLNNVKISLDERNCLCITSPTTSFQKIITNDIAEIYADGSFKILGRADNIINSGGVKIQLEEVEQSIEKIFEKMKLQRRFYCIGTNDEYWGQILTLCIEGESLTADVEEHLHENLKMLPKKYHIPKKIVYQHKFTETETGKIKRQIP
ncbi:MAG: AMP-binding protein [Raineya sp.]